MMPPIERRAAPVLLGMVVVVIVGLMLWALGVDVR